MKIKAKGLTLPKLEKIVQAVSRKLYAGNVRTYNPRDLKIAGDTVTGFRLGTRHPSKGPGGTLSYAWIDGKDVPKWTNGRACWHVHRDVMRAVLKAFPDAVITTGLATYRGDADFEAKHRNTYDRSGFVIERIGDRCECE